MWKLLMSYLVALLAVISPGVDDPFGDDTPPDDDVPPNDDDTPPDDDDDTPPDDDTPSDDDDAPPPRQMTRAQKDIIETRKRAQDAEAKLAQAQAELEAARRQPSQPQAQNTEEQRVWQQEEDVLRNPESSDWQKYAIQANRQARLANSNSQNALRRAEDLADLTKFEQLAIQKPKMFNAYKDKVEAELTRLRANGNNAPREELLALLIGRDLRDGKLKAGSSTPPKKGGAGRGTTPGARSDVASTGSGRMTESEKRAKRLENIRI